MRQPVVCTGESAAYRLQIRRNGTLLVDRVVHGGGWRRDRPLYIFQEVQQAPGDSSMAVTFERVGAPGAEGATRPGGADAFTSFLPPRLTLEQTFHFRAGEVVLVTYDDSRRRLVAIRSDAR
jgi:hypothetical protein